MGYIIIILSEGYHFVKKNGILFSGKSLKCFAILAKELLGLHTQSRIFEDIGEKNLKEAIPMGVFITWGEYFSVPEGRLKMVQSEKSGLLSRPSGTEETGDIRPGNELPGYFQSSLRG